MSLQEHDVPLWAAGLERGHEGGSWGWHWGTPCSRGGWKASYPETSRGQELHVFGSLSPANDVNEGGLQCFIFVVGGGRQDDGFNFVPCCDVVQCHNLMVELSKVCCIVGGL